MRILIVSHVFWPENFRLNDLAAELAARGHDVTVLTGIPNYPEGRVFPEFERDPKQFTNFKGVAVVRVPIITRGQGRVRLVLNYLSYVLSGSLIGAWRLRKRSFDVIFVHESSPVTVGLPAIVLRALKKAPIAFWVLDLWPETLEAIGIVRSRVLLNAVGKLVSFIYSHCDLILAQSRSFMPQIANYCEDSSKVVYFPSWAEPLFSDNTHAPASEVPQKEHSFNVMFAGNIGEAQDFPSVLAAAELLKSDRRVRWLVVGDGRMRAWVDEEIRRRELQDCVLMLGRHPVERMPSFYQHADALLVSLKDEPIFSMTIPGKLQSYLAAGIPIVAMLNGEGADVVERSRSGVRCRAGDANGLAAAISRLAALSPEEREIMGRNALTVSAEEFNRNKLITKLEGWLESLSAGKSAGVMNSSCSS